MEVALLYVGEVNEEAGSAHLCRWVSESEKSQTINIKEEEVTVHITCTDCLHPHMNQGKALPNSRKALGLRHWDPCHGCAHVNDTASFRMYPLLHILSGLLVLPTIVNMLNLRGELENASSCDGQPPSWRV